MAQWKSTTKTQLLLKNKTPQNKERQHLAGNNNGFMARYCSSTVASKLLGANEIPTKW